LRPFSFRRILAWRFLGRFCLPERQSLARGVEATELIFHFVDFIADPLEHGLEPQAVGREAVQMVEDADESMRSRRLAGVDLAADEIERPLEPRDLQERKVVCGIGVAPIKLLADDLLDTTEAEVFRGRDGAHRLTAHQASEDPPRALMLLGHDLDGLCGSGGHAGSFRRNRHYSADLVNQKSFVNKSLVWLIQHSPVALRRAPAGYRALIRPLDREIAVFKMGVSRRKPAPSLEIRPHFQNETLVSVARLLLRAVRLYCRSQ
jgi:hypothetical protein